MVQAYRKEQIENFFKMIDQASAEDIGRIKAKLIVTALSLKLGRLAVEQYMTLLASKVKTPDSKPKDGLHKII